MRGTKEDRNKSSDTIHHIYIDARYPRSIYVIVARECSMEPSPLVGNRQPMLLKGRERKS